MKEIEEQLKQLEIEDYIWIIFIFVSIAALISNYFERKWVINHQIKDHNIYKTINIDLLIISFLVYFYFLILSYKNYQKKHQNGTIKDMFFSSVGLISATLFLVAGLIEIFISSNTDVMDGDFFL